MIRLRQIKIDILNDTQEELLTKIAKKLKISKNKINDYKINKKAIDARKKDNIK